MHLLVERVIAAKADLDVLVDDEPTVRARPPASLERLAQVRRLFEVRGLVMPADYERVLRAHDGIDHVWRSALGSFTLLGHEALLASASVGEPDVVVGASDAGERVALVPAQSELPALVATDPRGHVVERFPSVTAWLEWILRAMTDELDERTTSGHWPRTTPVH
jgi:hypothetical protein